MRRFLLILALCAVVFSLPKGWKSLRGPSLRLLHRVDGGNGQAVLETKSAGALDQPFFSWGRGSQSEVFLSRDGKWVIKIPRNKKTRSYLLGRFRKESRMRQGCIESYLFAGRELAEETAVAYAHPGGALEMPKHFGLYDFLGRRLPMDPVLYPFALQERKPLLAKKLLDAPNPEEAKRLLSALLDLIEAERAKGWICSDYAFELNLGYEEGRAYRIDIGSYLPLNESYSWKAIAKPIDRFLEKGKDLELLQWWRNEVAMRQGSLNRIK